MADVRIRYRLAPYGSDVSGELLIDGEPVLSHISSNTQWLQQDLAARARAAGFPVPDDASTIPLEGRKPAFERQWAVLTWHGGGVQLYGCQDCGVAVWDQTRHAAVCPS